MDQIEETNSMRTNSRNRHHYDVIRNTNRKTLNFSNTERLVIPYTANRTNAFLPTLMSTIFLLAHLFFQRLSGDSFIKLMSHLICEEVVVRPIVGYFRHSFAFFGLRIGASTVGGYNFIFSTKIP